MAPTSKNLYLLDFLDLDDVISNKWLAGNSRSIGK